MRTRRRTKDPIIDIILECDCGTVSHIVKMEYWLGQQQLYLSSPMKVDNVWRRFREALRLIVWGEIDSGFDVILDVEEILRLNDFISTTTDVMLEEIEREEMENEREE